jgi:hypothetical protein
VGNLERIDYLAERTPLNREQAALFFATFPTLTENEAVWCVRESLRLKGDSPEAVA